MDPDTKYPTEDEYPYPNRFTYLLGDGVRHPKHYDIIDDDRLAAIFTLKKGQKVEDPGNVGLRNHKKICIEKNWKAQHPGKRDDVCLCCRGLCNYS